MGYRLVGGQAGRCSGFSSGDAARRRAHRPRQSTAHIVAAFLRHRCGLHAAAQRRTRRSSPRARPNEGRTSIGVSKASGNAKGGRSVEASGFSEAPPAQQRRHAMSANSDSPEVVIVGGGIGGSALACVLASEGIATTIVEKSTVHTDIVRGEWIAPWGVAETERLGLYELLLNAGGHHLKRHISFGDDIEAELAQTQTLDMTAFE